MTSKGKDKQTKRQNAPAPVDQLAIAYNQIVDEWKAIVKAGKAVTSKFTDKEWADLEKESWQPQHDGLSLRVGRYRKAQTEVARRMAQLWRYWDNGGDEERHRDEAVKAADADKFMTVREGLAKLSGMIPMDKVGPDDTKTLARMGIEFTEYTRADAVRMRLAHGRRVRQAQKQREQAQEAQKRRQQKRQQEGTEHGTE